MLTVYVENRDMALAALIGNLVLAKTQRTDFRRRRAFADAAVVEYINVLRTRMRRDAFIGVARAQVFAFHAQHLEDEPVHVRIGEMHGEERNARRDDEAEPRERERD